MADLNKFEKMLELLVNENKEAAQELFHEIVVEKSRDIYESLLEDEDDVEETTDEEVDESDEDLEEADDEVDESDEDLDENFSLDTFEVEADDEEADDMGDEEADDMGDEEGEEDEGEEDEGDMEDRVEDLEDALDDLKAEFEKMMAGDDEGEEGDDDMGGDATDDMMGDLGMDTEESAAEDESFQATITPMETKAALSAGEQMREYVEKVSATMGDNGADAKSAVAGPNNMGGTTANLVKGGESKGEGTQGGLAAPTPKDMNTKNVNVPGAKGATKMSSTKGHGAEKKASGDNGVNTKSTIGK